MLASVKHRIDGFLAKQPQDLMQIMVEQARMFLISRENRLVNARKNVLEAAAQCPSPKKNYTSNEIIYVNDLVKTMPTRGKNKTYSISYQGE